MRKNGLSERQIVQAKYLYENTHLSCEKISKKLGKCCANVIVKLGNDRNWQRQDDYPFRKIMDHRQTVKFPKPSTEPFWPRKFDDIPEATAKQELAQNHNHHQILLIEQRNRQLAAI